MLKVCFGEKLGHHAFVRDDLSCGDICNDKASNACRVDGVLQKLEYKTNTKILTDSTTELK